MKTDASSDQGQRVQLDPSSDDQDHLQRANGGALPHDDPTIGRSDSPPGQVQGQTSQALPLQAMNVSLTCQGMQENYCSWSIFDFFKNLFLLRYASMLRC